MKTLVIPFLMACFSALAGSAGAGQLQLAPVLIDVAAPAATSSMTITNSGKERMTVQARLFGWKQKGNKDAYFKTRDVVVSPPILKLKPGQSGVVRIVRLSKKPDRGEESYRLIVDELPKSQKNQRSTVQMVIRHSVPVFFSAVKAAASTSWKAVQKKGKLVLQGRNSGSSRIKLSQMSVVDSRGRKVSFGAGLNGYILGGSSRAFVANATTKLAGSNLKLVANSNLGKIRKSVKLTR